MISNKRWVVLFGGAGREACVERMLYESVDIQAIVIPVHRNYKLNQSVDRLRALPCKLIEIEKLEINDTLRQFNGCALFSIGFPYLIPNELLEMFQPALNLHPTLLPRYRGPTTGAYILINDEQESGSTVHYMVSKMDCGDIVAQNRVSITAFDTIRSLQRKVYAEEPQLVIDALVAIENGAEIQPQDESLASVFPKRRTPEDSEINSSQPLIELINQIRACDADDFPAFFFYKGYKVFIRLWRSESDRDSVDEI